MDWNILLSPPVAFLAYIPLVALIAYVGRALAGPSAENPQKHTLISSGEEAQTHAASPGYAPFFLIAFFFAILHLGMLVMGSGSFQTISPVYVVGLALALVALILG